MINTSIKKMKNHLAVMCSIMVLCTASWYKAWSGLPPGINIPVHPSITRVGGGVGGGIGGIRVIVDDKLIKADLSTAMYAMDTLYVTFKDREVVKIPLSPDELSELVHIVSIDKDGMLEVSIDPIADAKNGYMSPELGTSNVGWSFLILDGKIARLLEGNYALPVKYRGTTRTPPDVAHDLLLSNNPTGKDYRQVVDQNTTFSHSWHNTTIKVLRGKNGHIQFQVHLDPVPVFLSPDGRRVYPSGEEKKAASIPYNDLVKAFESDPESFTGSVPALDSCLRYIKAFALLAAWENASPISWHKKIDEQIRACWSRESDKSDTNNYHTSRLGDSTNTFLQEIAMLAKQSLIRAAWREYRMSFDPEKMKPEQRIAVFVDEAVAHYSSLENYKELVFNHAGCPDSLFKFINGIDLDNPIYKYTGWAYLGKAILGVWLGHSLDEILKCFGKADERAQIDQDHALRYQILKAVDNLLPVLKSNLYLDSMENKLPQHYMIWYDPMHRKMDTTCIDPRHILKYFEDSIEIAIENHMRDEYQRMEIAITSLFNNRGQLKVSALEVIRVWNSYQQSHLFDERHRIELVRADEWTEEQNPEDLYRYKDPVLAQWGKIQFALGVSSYNKSDFTMSRNCARVLSSMTSIATKEEWYATAGILQSWHEQLIALNGIKN
jgi:hypothetical protein